MGYLHIDNLYKNQSILYFKECWALEKLHGTSAHIRWSDNKIWFSSGGESHVRFSRLFDESTLTEAFSVLGHSTVIVYGEAYGGSQQKQAWRYGSELRFAAFDVRIGDSWLAVPNADLVVCALGLEFVHYKRVLTDLSALDAERDAPSEQAVRNGVAGDKPREGVVLRPIVEFVDNRGERIICKHKRDEERETATPRKVVDPEKLIVLENAAAIAVEWVTETRLSHVLDKLGNNLSIEATKQVIDAMLEDVLREGASEIKDSKEARAAISRKAASMFKEHLKKKLCQ